MIERVIILSLIITAIHVTMCEGMLLNPLRVMIGNVLDKIKLSVLKKPIYECLICMGGIYTIVLYPILWGFSWSIIPTMVSVIGLNCLIAKYLETYE